jgi:hypothetical protein
MYFFIHYLQFIELKVWAKKYCKNLARSTVIYNQTSLTLNCLYQFDGNKRENLTTFLNGQILSQKVENPLEK